MKGRKLRKLRKEGRKKGSEGRKKGRKEGKRKWGKKGKGWGKKRKWKEKEGKISKSLTYFPNFGLFITNKISALWFLNMLRRKTYYSC